VALSPALATTLFVPSVFVPEEVAAGADDAQPASRETASSAAVATDNSFFLIFFSSKSIQLAVSRN